MSFRRPCGTVLRTWCLPILSGSPSPFPPTAFSISSCYCTKMFAEISDSSKNATISCQNIQIRIHDYPFLQNPRISVIWAHRQSIMGSKTLHLMCFLVCIYSCIFCICLPFMSLSAFVSGLASLSSSLPFFALSDRHNSITMKRRKPELCLDSPLLPPSFPSSR